MTEKRFDDIEISEKTVAFYDNGEFTVLDENGLGKLLNRLHRENIYLSRIRESQQQMILKLYEANEQLKKSEKINMEYAEQIVEENHKLRIAKNDLRIENEQLKAKVKRLQDIGTRTEAEKEEYADLYNECRKKLECCEYEHFLNELDEIHEKVDKGDLSDFSPLKEDKPLNDYNPLKEKVYYWQCKYYRRDYEHKMDRCARCNYNGLLNYCLKDKCDKMVKSDYEVTIDEFGSGVSIGLKKRVDKR